MSLRHTLLGILDWVPLHGYALRESAKGFSWIHPMNNTNIYTTLRQLESEGFVVHREEVREGRLRKVYSVTEAGRRELRRWLCDETGQKGSYRDPVLLKTCLLRPGAMRGASLWLRRELEVTSGAATGTEQLLADESVALPRYTRMVAEHALELARVRERFLARVLEAVEEDVEAEA